MAVCTPSALVGLQTISAYGLEHVYGSHGKHPGGDLVSQHLPSPGRVPLRTGLSCPDYVCSSAVACVARCGSVSRPRGAALLCKRVCRSRRGGGALCTPRFSRRYGLPDTGSGRCRRIFFVTACTPARSRRLESSILHRVSFGFRYVGPGLLATPRPCNLLFFLFLYT
ncbi:hypothetical protein EDC01DRAFT_336378 [Geopyxis carbonaria]|nr:hypothetical protein EDC01DRAFT_336378 [Geopyxis carbonaria]